MEELPSFPFPILLFDGLCNLCNNSVQFVLKRDKGSFRFASLQSELGKRLCAKYNLPPDSMDTLVLIKNNACYIRSDAALETARMLNGAWPILYLFIIVPRPIRDLVYKWVSKNRYRWFGKKESCMIPTPDLKKRFLEV